MEHETETLKQLGKAVLLQAALSIDDLRDADKAVDQARADLRIAGQNVQRARAELAACLTTWNAGAPVLTPEQLRRQHINASQADRARRAEAGLVHRPLTVSETAKAIGIGGHRSQRGGGAAYRRGAFSKAQALEVNARRAAAEQAAAKLPSEK